MLKNTILHPASMKYLKFHVNLQNKFHVVLTIPQEKHVSREYTMSKKTLIMLTQTKTIINNLNYLKDEKVFLISSVCRLV